MLPIKKILCPTDFSDPSYEALGVAIEYARHFSAELILCNVVPPIPVLPTPDGSAVLNVPTYQQEMEIFARKSLGDVVRERIPPEVRTREVVALGDAAAEIVKLADVEEADLIIIATHGETGWRRFLYGSVTEKVVRLSGCPVLTIRKPRERREAGS